MATLRINPEVKKKIEKTAIEKCKEYAEYVKDEMVKKYQEEIDKFYEDPAYNPPKRYVRHEARGYERGMNLTYKPVLEEETLRVRGGIKISTDDMHPGGVRGSWSSKQAGYRGTQEQVLNSFLNGLHGVLYYNAMDNVFDRRAGLLSPRNKYIYRLSYNWTDVMAKNVAGINEHFLGGSNSSPMLESQRRLVELRDELRKKIEGK